MNTTDDSDSEVVLNPKAPEYIPKSCSVNDAMMLQLLADSQQQQRLLIDAIRLPTTQLTPFDGDPMKFWMLVRSFQRSVADKTEDDSAKLKF